MARSSVVVDVVFAEERDRGDDSIADDDDDDDDDDDAAATMLLLPPATRRSMVVVADAKRRDIEEYGRFDLRCIFFFGERGFASFWRTRLIFYTQFV